jgi:hypothetical protein
MRAISTRWLVIVPALLVAACSDSTTPGAGGPTAQLKVVHAASALGALDVRIGGSSVISGLTYGHSSAVTNVPAGAQTVVFRAGGNDVAQVDVTLSTSGINAIAFNGDTAQVTPVTPDTGQAAPARANVRFINVAGTNSSGPTLLSMLLNFPDVSQDSTATFNFDAMVPRHGSLMYFNAGHFRARFVPQGTQNVLTEIEFDVAAGQKKAIVLERSAAGSYSAKVVTEP